MSQYDKFLEVVEGQNKEIILKNDYKIVNLKDSGILFIFDKEGNLLDTYKNNLTLIQNMTPEELEEYNEYKNLVYKASNEFDSKKNADKAREVMLRTVERLREERYWEQ